MSNSELKDLLQILNDFGVSEYKTESLHLIIPHPKPSIARSLISISNEESKQIKGKLSEDEDLLFLHETFSDDNI